MEGFARGMSAQQRRELRITRSGGEWRLNARACQRALEVWPASSLDEEYAGRLHRPFLIRYSSCVVDDVVFVISTHPQAWEKSWVQLSAGCIDGEEDALYFGNVLGLFCLGGGGGEILQWWKFISQRVLLHQGRICIS